MGIIKVNLTPLTDKLCLRTNQDRWHQMLNNIAEIKEPDSNHTDIRDEFDSPAAKHKVKTALDALHGGIKGGTLNVVAARSGAGTTLWPVFEGDDDG